MFNSNTENYAELTLNFEEHNYQKLLYMYKPVISVRYKFWGH